MGFEADRTEETLLGRGSDGPIMGMYGKWVRLKETFGWQCFDVSGNIPDMLSSVDMRVLRNLVFMPHNGFESGTAYP
jgi:hypothetical protein